MDSLKILYVDDDDDIREVAELSLQMDPAVEVRVAGSGAEALHLLAAGDWAPDALLLDVMMPQMDGPAVLSALRSDDARPQPPVIFLTARVFPDEVERLRDLGAVGVLGKPFDPMTLAARVRAILERA